MTINVSDLNIRATVLNDSAIRTEIFRSENRISGSFFSVVDLQLGW